MVAAWADLLLGAGQIFWKMFTGDLGVLTAMHRPCRQTGRMPVSSQLQRQCTKFCERMMHTPGNQFRQAVHQERPLQVVGAINAIAALLAQKNGFKAIYLSGAGVANAAFGLPDLGLTSLSEVCEEVRRITAACSLPLLVDIDTGWGSALGIERTIQQLTRAGAAAVHLEDQVSEKRCGHRPGKQLVSCDEMCDRVRTACSARTDSSLVVMARTDAIAVEGLDSAIARAQRYVEVGADMIFAEALQSPQQMKTFTAAIDVPVLANMTEFGQTPLLNVDQLRECGISLALYPLSAFRAMCQAANTVYATIRREGSQQSTVGSMQTRQELYELLDYLQIEQRIDELLNKKD
jgi:methylisocitrate lyase